MKAQELVVDCATGMAQDQDLTEEQLGRQVVAHAESVATSQRARDRQGALTRLRQEAITDEVLADLLYVLGLLE